MKRFQELLMKDLGWKLLSVAIAAIIWFMVINITQPVDTRSYTRGITLKNMETLTDRELTIGNEEELKNAKVAVKVKAQRTALDRLNQSPEWIDVTVDLSELAYAVSGDVIALPVDVAMQGSITGYDIVSKSPAVVEVRIEKLETREFDVEVVLNGELPKDMYLSEPTLSNKTVVVQGPASLVSKVASVRATVNAEEIGKGTALRAKLIAYDHEGEPVRGVTISVSQVTVSYALQDVKQIPIQVDITGSPAPGYSVGNITCTPQYAEVTGTADVLKKLVYLQVDRIDVTGRNTDVTRVYSLEEYLPEGVSLKDSSGSGANVQIIVEIDAQAGRQVTLDASQLSILGQEADKTYAISGSVHVMLNGEEGLLNSLQEGDLKGTINVAGFDEGQHRAIVHVELPEGISAAVAYIDVTVSGTEQPPAEE